MRPGDDLGNTLRAFTLADASALAVYGTIVSIGKSTVDVVLDSRGGLLQKKAFVGTPRVGDRVKIQIVDDEITVLCPARTPVGATTVLSGFGAASSGVRVVSSDTTIGSGDKLLVVNKASAVTVTLCAATGLGTSYTIKNIGIGACTIDAATTELIDGSLTMVLYQYESATLADYLTGNWVAI